MSTACHTEVTHDGHTVSMPGSIAAFVNPPSQRFVYTYDGEAWAVDIDGLRRALQNHYIHGDGWDRLYAVEGNSLTAVRLVDAQDTNRSFDADDYSSVKQLIVDAEAAVPTLLYGVVALHIDGMA